MQTYSKIVLLLISTLLLSISSTVQAELHDRLNGQAAFDDSLNITWLTDAGLNGSTSWANQLAWVEQLNAQSYLGFSDWRLASMSVTSGIPTGISDSVYDCGTVWQPLCSDNELGYMFYYNLGGSLGDNKMGTHVLGDVTINNVQATYHSGTEFGTTTTWMLHFDSGFGVWTFKNANRHVWIVRDGDVLVSDTDDDGIADSADNCLLVANPTQLDSDADGFGNHCDLDLNNDGIVNFLDISEFVTFFNSALGGIADFNGDGFVNFLDYSLFALNMFQPPGPSGIE